ncbi:hypothetical protein HDE_13265 [Halotydeus destructor]|nr:hypothetical protein HDE_13265 [Halotydeus destructor]
MKFLTLLVVSLLSAVPGEQAWLIHRDPVVSVSPRFTHEHVGYPWVTSKPSYIGQDRERQDHHGQAETGQVVTEHSVGYWETRGLYQYLVIRTVPALSVLGVNQACEEFGGHLPEPETRDELETLKTLSNMTLIGAFYGKYQDKEWMTWRWLSDGRVVKKLTFDGRLGCDTSDCERTAVYLVQEGCRASASQRFNDIVCQRSLPEKDMTTISHDDYVTHA